jgi:hypothetical protein
MKERNIYAFAAFVTIGQRSAVELMRIIAPSYTIAKAIARREAETIARHESEAFAIIDGEPAHWSVDIAPLQ